MQNISIYSEICYGPMKSGKSRYLVQQAEDLFLQGLPFLAFKPLQDTRDGCWIKSRDSECRDVEALGINRAAEILNRINLLNTSPKAFFTQHPKADSCVERLAMRDYLAPLAKQPLAACLIDEVFLLDSGILEVLIQLPKQGIRVLVSGLDRDFRREFFPLRDFERTGHTMQQVIEHCQREIALTATCEVCQGAAPFTQRLVGGQPAHYNSPTVMIGDEEYQPRCLHDHRVLGHPQQERASVA